MYQSVGSVPQVRAGITQEPTLRDWLVSLHVVSSRCVPDVIYFLKIVVKIRTHEVLFIILTLCKCMIQ